jgi:hypothetical protein
MIDAAQSRSIIQAQAAKAVQARLRAIQRVYKPAKTRRPEIAAEWMTDQALLILTLRKAGRIIEPEPRDAERKLPRS